MRKKAIIISLCVLALLAAILIPVLLLPRRAPDKVVVIPLSGTIATGGSSLSSGSTITPGRVRSYLARAERDEAVKAIVLRIESPGGEIEPCREILLEIERAKETKTIVVSVDEYYEQFIDVVAEGRRLSEERVEELATGQLYSGSKAKELGLVDELGDLDTAIDLAMELAGIETAIVKYYKPPRPTLWSLLGLVDAMKARISGSSAEDMILLEILDHNYPQPLFLYQS